MSMRDEIAKVMHDSDMHDDSLRDIADKIIKGTIPYSIPDLVWREIVNTKVAESLGFSYSLEFTNGKWCVGVLGATGYEVLYRGSSGKKATTVANEHHRAQIMSTLGVKP